MSDETKKQPKAPKDLNPKPDVIKYSGLCSVCVHSPTCAYRDAQKEGAIFCEMFDGDNPHDSENDSTRPAISFRAAGSPVDPDKKYQGLCVNCFHRVTCSLATSHGGVWHCEEYRLE